MGLADRMQHHPTQLSGGEQQRVAIARSLIGQPTLVLGDEPMGEVDTETSTMLLSLMRRINIESNVTFLIVIHDLDLASRMDRIVRLKDGHLISDERVPNADAGRHPDRAAMVPTPTDARAALSIV
jgi:predicted ABC-type transport system involved in lysophospholipase L1 biosynthesis ATPase subunit